MPKIKSPIAYGKTWLKWWTVIQPDWRDVGSWPFPQDAEEIEGWGKLLYGGKDGIFVVVMSLGWWTHAEKPSGDSILDDAIDDVSWVLRYLTSSLSSPAITTRPASSTTTTRSPSPSDTPTPAARRGGGPVKVGRPKKRG